MVTEGAVALSGSGNKEIERYSFSKLKLFAQCPLAYDKRYGLGQEGLGNAFASFGTLMHSLMERYAKGEAEIWDLPELYRREFDAAVTEPFPPMFRVNLRKSYYRQGLDFLKRFQGYDGYTILGSELRFETPIADWHFVGIIDLLFRDENGRLIVLDYKSKKAFGSEREKNTYARQLYLYSLYVKERYGQYPDELQFLLFRDRKLFRIPFEPSALTEAVDWAKKTVCSIRNAFDFPPTCDAFYRDNLMTVDLGANENNVLLRQTECVNELIRFAMKYSVAVVLVAHPRKMPKGEEVGTYDVSGSANIINLAHRAISLRRIDKEREKSGHDVCLTILKDRMRGKSGKRVNLYYDIPTRRFYTNEAEYDYRYSWDAGTYPPLPYPHMEEREVYGEC